MTEEDMVELHVKISSKELAEFKKELESKYGTITHDIFNKEVEARTIIGYIKAKKLKLIGTG